MGEPGKPYQVDIEAAGDINTRLSMELKIRFKSAKI
jgi:hypothetical protein